MEAEKIKVPEGVKQHIEKLWIKHQGGKVAQNVMFIWWMRS